MTKTNELEKKAKVRIGSTLKINSELMTCTGLSKAGKKIRIRAIPVMVPTFSEINEWEQSNEAALNGEFAFQPGRYVAEI